MARPAPSLVLGALLLATPALGQSGDTAAAPLPAVIEPQAPPSIAPASVPSPATAPAPAPATAPEPPQVAAVPPVALDHPQVVDTATLASGGQSYRLFGITGLGGASATSLQSFIAGAGDRVTCDPHPPGEYICRLPDGADVALAALLNGAARSRADATDDYRRDEAEAQAARRGLWVSLPPPPADLRHPTVIDTATLAADGQTYMLDGIIGFAGSYAHDLQGYVGANGDRLSCQPQGPAGDFLCRLPDGTDLAKVALLNGAARVDVDAPDAYRTLQGQALAARRGIWFDPPADLVAEVEAPPPPGMLVPYGAVVGEPDDGITYVDGTPTALIDGAAVALVFAGGLGWGYYDHDHHWRGAPDRYYHHLDRYHPNGEHLRGYGPAYRHDPGFRREAAYRQTGVGHPPGPNRAALAPAGRGRPAAFNRPTAARPAFAGATAHPAAAAFIHPGGGSHPMPAKGVCKGRC